MSKRPCPWCLEELPPDSRIDRGAACPRCRQPLVDSEGKSITALSLRFNRITKEQRQAFKKFMIYGTGLAAALMLAAPLLHSVVSPFLVAPFLILVHNVTLRLLVLSESRRFLGARRRFFLRWTGRLAWLWLGIPGYGLTMLPVIGVVPGVATFVAISTLLNYYSLWSLRRERDRLPLIWWEKLALTAVAILTIAVLVAGVIAVLALGWSIIWITNRWR